MHIYSFTDQELTNDIKDGKIGILPTDTIYGIHASAFAPQAIEQMYKIRLRDSNKPFIVLIHSIEDLDKFSITLTDEQREILTQVWQQSVSVILPVNNKQFEYLTRGSDSIAFRIPHHAALRELLQKTGPLVSTSVNKQGEEPAKSVAEALSVFQDELSFAVDEGVKVGTSSTVVRFDNNKLEILRQGSSVIPNELIA